MSGIHCKVVCEDQIRRFHFSGNEFSSLQHQVRQLLGLNREFVLKYKDNENDMITISSTEELYCATEISRKEKGGILRLTIFFTEPTTTTTKNDVPPIHHGHDYGHGYHGRNFGHGHDHHHGHDFGHGPDRPGRDFGHGPDHPGRDFGHGPDRPGRDFGHGPDHPGRDFGHGHGPDRPGREFGHGGRWGQYGGGGRGCHDFRKSWKNFEKQECQFGGPENHPWKGQKHGNEHPCKNRLEKRKNKLTFKRDMFNAYLSSLDQFKELSPEDQRRKQIYQEKVKKIDNVLSQHFSTEPQVESEKEFSPKKCQRKYEKKEKKFERKEMKKELKNSKLSEEEKSEITSLKNQIKELKPVLWTINEQLKSKKTELRQSLNNGLQNPHPSLRGDIAKLKNEKRDIKQKIAPLRQRIYELKAGGK